jgi:hypothetical protein
MISWNCFSSFINTITRVIEHAIRSIISVIKFATDPEYYNNNCNENFITNNLKFKIVSSKNNFFNFIVTVVINSCCCCCSINLISLTINFQNFGYFDYSSYSDCSRTITITITNLIAIVAIGQ